VVIGDFKHDHNHRHPFGAGLSHPGRVRCGLQAHPPPRDDLRDQL